MAFALTKFKADGIRHTGPTRSHGEQIAVFSITAANTDTALDIATSGGTFWTAARANSTYGDLATAAWRMFFDKSPYGSIPAAVATNGLLAVEGPNMVTYVKVLSLTAGNQYTISITSDIPSLAFNSGSAPTSYTLTLRWLLADNLEPVIADLGAAIT